VVFTDDLGRIKVQFHWQRPQDHPEGTAALDERSSCWVRVAHPSSGATLGTQLLPRVGQEVLVSFLEGDPDQPLVVGAVHNGTLRPPAFSGQSSLPGDKALSGIRTHELKGRKGSELLFDDTPGELRARLATEEEHSELNLGSLVHPRRNGRGEARGQGAELRTDGAGALRAARGLLLSAEAQEGARGRLLDRQALLAHLREAVDLLEGLEDHASRFQGQGAGNASRPLEDLVKGWEKEGAPLVALSAPRGLVASTPAQGALHAGQNLDLVAGENGHLAAARRLTLHGGQGMTLFSHGEGLQLIAHKGDQQLQAQHGSMSLEAREGLRLTATDQDILLHAGRKLTLLCGGAYLTLSGGAIELGAPGGVKVKTDQLAVSASAEMTGELPRLEAGKTFKRFVHRSASTGDPLPESQYRLHLKDGSVKEGLTDPEGKTDNLELEDLEDLAAEFPEADLA
jgi:type VI secretion system secreted protein VgrG